MTFHKAGKMFGVYTTKLYTSLVPVLLDLAISLMPTYSKLATQA